MTGRGLYRRSGIGNEDSFPHPAPKAVLRSFRCLLGCGDYIRTSQEDRFLYGPRWARNRLCYSAFNHQIHTSILPAFSLPCLPLSIFLQG